MSNIKSLLVALDFRDCNSKICNEAITFANNMNAEVTLIHVVEYIPYYECYPYNSEEVLKRLYQEVTERMDKFAKLFKQAGIKVNPHIIKKGKAATLICKTADKINACGIILGLGEHYLLENIIGSTADKVSRMAKQAVFLMNTHKRKQVFKRILCAFDFTENSYSALEFAIQMADTFNAPLNVIQIIHKNSYYFDIEPGSPLFNEQINELNMARKVLTKIISETIAKQKMKGMSFKVHIRTGEAVSEISELIEEQQSSLLIIGSSSHNAASRFLLGSTSTKLIHNSPCSVITLKEVHEKEKGIKPKNSIKQKARSLLNFCTKL